MTKEFDKKGFEQGLLDTSSAGERIKSIKLLGFSDSELAVLLEASRPTVANWRQENGPIDPQGHHARRLDSIRLVARVLVEGAVPPENIRSWFHTRSSQPPHDKPFELMPWDPKGVLDLAKFAVEQRIHKESGLPSTPRF